MHTKFEVIINTILKPVFVSIHRSSDAKAEISYNDANSLMVSGIQSGRKTYFVVDGFLSNSTTPMSTNTSSGKHT